MKTSSEADAALASLLKSAEAWAAEGLKEFRLASVAVAEQRHHTAENHRKNAALANAQELALRRLILLPDPVLPLSVCLQP